MSDVSVCVHVYVRVFVYMAIEYNYSTSAQELLYKVVEQYIGGGSGEKRKWRAKEGKEWGRTEEEGGRGEEGLIDSLTNNARDKGLEMSGPLWVPCQVVHSCKFFSPQPLAYLPQFTDFLVLLFDCLWYSLPEQLSMVSVVGWEQ